MVFLGLSAEVRSSLQTMRKIVLIAMLAFATSLPSLGADNPPAQQLLDGAYRPSDLFQKSNAPFEIELGFSAQSTVPQQGHLLLRWKAKNEWWSKVIFGPFQQIMVRNGEMEYTLRNLDFTPMAVREVFKLLQLRQDGPQLSAKRVKERVDHGVKLSCIQAQSSDSLPPAHDLCIEPLSHELRSDELKPPEPSKQLFDDYFDFQGIRFPRRLALLMNGRSVISADVVRLDAFTFNPTLLSPPKGAIERRHCPGIRHAEIVKNADIVYNPPLNGSDVFSITVLTDGSVGDVQLLASGGQAMDQPTLAAFKKMKFKAAMCGDQPVVSDMEIHVNATHY
jgi:hypothetical protein